MAEVHVLPLALLVLGLLLMQLVVDGLGLLELLSGGLIVVLDIHLERLYQIADN